MGFPFNMLLKDVVKILADFEVRRDAESLAKPGEMVHAMRIKRDGRDLLLVSEKAYAALAQAGAVDATEATA